MLRQQTSSESEDASPKKTKLENVDNNQVDGAKINWKQLKQQRKAERRKWREKKLLKQLEKVKEKDAMAAARQEEEKKEERLKAVVGRSYTVSIAVPGSILDNAQSPELRTYLAGQIARAAVVFNVDEIVIFDETGNISRSTEGEFHGIGKKGHANVQLARVLQYLECPQYLRKAFFPQHKDLQYAGVLNPLDCPHHMRAEDVCPYREGVVVQKPCKPGKGSFVNVGTLKELQIDKQLQPGLRVTVKVDLSYTSKKKLKGTVVSPLAPTQNSGLYWGYSVRLARSLGAVFTECPYDDGYDLTVGTSDKGDAVDEVTLPKFRHALIVFGGLRGLEASLEADEGLEVEDPRLLFHLYLNTCPHQGSATIRTEEAVLITLSALRPQIQKVQKPSNDL